MSIHAAYLYDSVKLYARALDQLIRDQPDQTVEEIANNGTRIIETIIKNHTYQSNYILPETFFLKYVVFVIFRGSRTLELSCISLYMSY